jgi:hypothetical protein
VHTVTYPVLLAPSQWDEGSKRKKVWCVPTLVGSRSQGDGSRMREVLGAAALLPDWSDGGKKKSGKNVAQAVVTTTLDFLYPDGPPPTQSAKVFYRDLYAITFLLSDFTTSNSGKVKGSGAIIQKSIHLLSDHLLVFHGPCVSHVGHNECGQVSSSFGDCERQPISRRKKKRDCDGILSCLLAMVPAILDDLVHVMERFPEILRYLAQQEGRRQLRMAVIGVDTRCLDGGFMSTRCAGSSQWVVRHRCSSFGRVRWRRPHA